MTFRPCTVVTMAIAFCQLAAAESRPGYAPPSEDGPFGISYPASSIKTMRDLKVVNIDVLDLGIQARDLGSITVKGDKLLFGAGLDGPQLQEARSLLEEARCPADVAAVVGGRACTEPIVPFPPRCPQSGSRRQRPSGTPRPSPRSPLCTPGGSGCPRTSPWPRPTSTGRRQGATSRAASAGATTTPGERRHALPWTEPPAPPPSFPPPIRSPATACESANHYRLAADLVMMQRQVGCRRPPSVAPPNPS